MQQNLKVDDEVAAVRKESWENVEKTDGCCSDHVWLYATPDADGNYIRVPKYMCDWIQFSLRNYCVDRDKWNDNFTRRRLGGYQDRVC